MPTTIKVGETYGGLVVVSLDQNPEHRSGKGFKVQVRCVHCTAVVYRDRANVKSFTLKSCGCRRNVVTTKRKSKYGD